MPAIETAAIPKIGGMARSYDPRQLSALCGCIKKGRRVAPPALKDLSRITD